MASVAMASSATAQHNLAVLQSQLQTLQIENATLTKELCVKENHVLQKEQQFRVLQQRMEELESAVALWKDRYLHQLQLHAAAASTSASATASASTVSAFTTGEWTALQLPQPSSAQEIPNADAMGSLVEKLSTSEREKLKTLIGAERTRSPAQQNSPWDETFTDISEELQSVLLQYLVPVLLETQRIESQRQHSEFSSDAMVIRCLTRAYTKQATDFKIVCQRQSTRASVAERTTSENTSSRIPTTSTPSTASSSNRPTTMRSPSQIDRVDGAILATTSTTPPPSSSSSAAPPTIAADRLPPPLPHAAAETAAEEHLFDCVDCEHAKRLVSHGPREIHPTKAVYVSRALVPPPTTAYGSVGASAASAIRRYSLAPSKLNDTSRPVAGSGLSLTGYPSATSTTSVTRSDNALSVHESDTGDRRSGASASSSSLTGSAPPQSGKIKKIMGSVMKGLHRHKPPQLPMSTTTTTTTSSSNTPQAEDNADDDHDHGDDADGVSICDGCGRGPLTGAKWVCRTCQIVRHQVYALCEKCYGQGLHGKENDGDLFERIEEIVVAKCPKLVSEQELMKLLRVGICKANLKKYSFCLTWIADLIQCKSTAELRARALEISQISPHVRSEFVRLLTELLTKYRRNIELITEWQPDTNVAAASATGLGSGGGGGGGGGEGGEGADGGGGDGGGGMLQLDTLRIWVKDAVESTGSGSGSGSL